MKLWGSLSELVSLIFRKDSQQITVRPNQATTYTGARDIQLPPGDAAHVLTSANSTQVLTNKSIDADTNTITNIENADIKSGAAIDASKIADGSVSSTEFQYIGGLTSDAQTQLNAKLDDFSSANDNRLVRTNGTAGDAVQESVATLSDAGALSGLTQLDVDNLRIDGNTVSSTSGDVNIDAGVNAVSITTANVLLRGGAELAFYDNDNSNAIVVSVPNNITTNRAPQIPDDTGNFVLDSATQTLTNKTLTAPTLDDYFDVNEETAPSTPSAGKVRVYAKSDKKLYTKDSSGVEQEIGSGSASGNVSFFFDDLENGSAANWTGYADAAAAAPVDGTGGTATTLTVTASSSSPLRETFSLSVAKSAANGQGQGIAAAVTIPSGYQQAAKRVIEFLWDGSGANYVAGDMACYVYDVTNSLLITPSVTALPAAKVPIQISWDSSSSASYRLIFHVATTNASAYTVKLDDITVGPGQIMPVPAVGTMLSYTPTVTNVTPSGVTGFYKRDSDTLIVSGRFTVSVGGGASPITFSIPPGLTIDATKLLSGSIGSGSNTVGFGFSNVGAADNRSFIVFPASTTTLSFLDTDEGAGVIDGNDPGAGTVLSFNARIPIAEWAGAPNYAGQNDVEYASNDSTTDADNTTSFAYGPNGSLVPTVASTITGTARLKRVRFLTPIQVTDKIQIELQLGGTGAWIPLESQRIYATNLQQSGTRYGIGWTSVSGSNTDIEVAFQRGGVNASNATYASAGGSMPDTAGDRYRVLKIRAGAAVGFGAATNDRLGLVKPSYTLQGTTQASLSLTDLVRSGTYTPTATANANLDSNPSVIANSMIWSQVGKVVTCSGFVGVDPTTINTASSFTLTLPVLPTSNFSAFSEGLGTANFSTSGLGSTGTIGTVNATSGAKTVTLGFYATEILIGRNFFYQFQYVVN